MPRTALLILILATTWSLSGCAGFWRPRTEQILPPTIHNSDLNKATVLDVINRNTDAVKQLEADIRISMTGLPTSISGTLVMERPHRMRLQAGFLGVNDLGVDIGSNEELFWIWPKSSLPGQPSSIKYARHREFAQSPAFAHMRLQPQWIVDALGLVSFSPNDHHEGPFKRKDKLLEFHSHLGSGTESMTRVVAVNPKYGWIEQLALYDSKGSRIAYANAVDHAYIDQQAVIPRFIELNVFPAGSEKITLEIDLKRIKLTPLYVDANEIWTMPSPENVEQIDISKLPDSRQRNFPAGRANSAYPGSRRTQFASAGPEFVPFAIAFRKYLCR